VRRGVETDQREGIRPVYILLPTHRRILVGVCVHVGLDAGLLSKTHCLHSHCSFAIVVERLCQATRRSGIAKSIVRGRGETYRNRESDWEIGRRAKKSSEIFLEKGTENREKIQAKDA
jgi:hypothetical protein